jgi:hypothetical protein
LQFSRFSSIKEIRHTTADQELLLGLLGKPPILFKFLDKERETNQLYIFERFGDYEPLPFIIVR